MKILVIGGGMGGTIVAAENVAALIKIGGPMREYDGKVFCFIEAGKDRATYVSFNYKTPPPPSRPSSCRAIGSFLPHLAPPHAYHQKALPAQRRQTASAVRPVQTPPQRFIICP